MPVPSMLVPPSSSRREEGSVFQNSSRVLGYAVTCCCRCRCGCCLWWAGVPVWRFEGLMEDTGRCFLSKDEVASTTTSTALAAAAADVGSVPTDSNATGDEDRDDKRRRGGFTNSSSIVGVARQFNGGQSPPKASGSLLVDLLLCWLTTTGTLQEATGR